MSSAWERMIRGLGILIIIACLIVALTPVSNFAGKKFAILPDKKPADAIVVLGAGLMNAGSLQDESLRRVIAGIDLYKQGLAPLIVLSGGARRDDMQHTEAQQRSILAQTMGIPAEAILKEETSNTTREEAVRISRLLMHRGLRKILLVTESLHLRRAKAVFESAGLEVFPATSDDYSVSAISAKDRLWLASRIIEESAALAYYRLAGYF
ncbi:MAG TPA: YdcF family protein [Terriglobia bacterium]|nr:YdcF family protein [Terriglobia bacterium]